jgi:hypothetical protein
LTASFRDPELLKELISDDQLDDVVDQVLVALAEDLLEVSVVELIVLTFFQTEKENTLRAVFQFP